jgi:hypothetical protein
MDEASVFELIGQTVSIVSVVVGGWWALEKWRRRDEHFPRIYFEVSANFIGVQDDQFVTELVASLENKGVVPLQIEDFSFRLLGLKTTDNLEKGGDEVRRQLFFPHVIEEGLFIPKHWGYSFVYPGVNTEYNFVTLISREYTFIRIQADFEYLARRRAAHHVAKILKVPELETDSKSS